MPRLGGENKSAELDKPHNYDTLFYDSIWSEIPFTKDAAPDWSTRLTGNRCCGIKYLLSGYSDLPFDIPLNKKELDRLIWVIGNTTDLVIGIEMLAGHIKDYDYSVSETNKSLAKELHTECQSVKKDLQILLKCVPPVALTARQKVMRNVADRLAKKYGSQPILLTGNKDYTGLPPVTYRDGNSDQQAEPPKASTIEKETDESNKLVTSETDGSLNRYLRERENSKNTGRKVF